MRRIPVLATTALVLALALAGCAAPAETESAPVSSETASPAETAAAAAEAATGETVTGTGYSFSVPEGWGVPADQPKPAGVDTLAGDLQSTAAFVSNVNVVLSPAGELTTEQAESAGAQELEGIGATDLQVLDRAKIAGSEAAHLTAVVTASGVEYRIDQYYVSNAGQTYVITFSVETTMSEADRAAIADAVLASWQWS
jgi:hypothetical protein